MTPSQARDKAAAICRYMSADNPEQVTISDDGEMIAIIFQIIPDVITPWRKAIELSTSIATPAAFTALLTGWKMGVLADIAEDKPSPIVRAACEHYGYERVLKALKPPSVH